jgi:hypothetical protein
MVAATTKDGAFTWWTAGRWAERGQSAPYSALPISLLARLPPGGRERHALDSRADGGDSIARRPFSTFNGAVTNGAVVAWKVAEQNGGLALEPGWSSRDLVSPLDAW